MKNFINRALVAKKHFKLFFALFAMLALGVGNAWAETGTATITFSSAGLSNETNVNNTVFTLGDYFTVTYTKNSASTNPTYYTSGSAIRCYATKNTSNGNIITIKQTDNGAEVNAYITKVTYSGTHSKKGTTAFTYSGSPTSSDANNAIYAASSKVTTATATLKETGGSTNGQFYSTGITIEYTYETSAPPATPYTVKFYKTSTTFDEIPETEAGSGVTPPTMEAECGEWSFQGWSESSSNSETSTTVLSTITLENGKYYPTADVNLYPVYTKTSTGGGTVTWNKVTTAPADWSGEYLIVNSNYAMTSDFKSGTAGEFLGASVTVSNNQVTSSPSDKMIWIVEKNGSTAQYSFKNKSTGTYAKITGTSSKNAALSNTVVWFTIGTSSTSGVWKIISVDYSARCFSYYSTDKTFRTYANSNTTGNLYKKEGSSSTTYYYSYPECSGEPEPVIVKTLKSITVSNVATTTFLEGSEFTFDGTCTATYSVTKNDEEQPQETKTIPSSSLTFTGYNMNTPGDQTVTVSYTENDKTVSTTYTITVTAKPTYAITWKVNGVPVSGGTTSVKEGAKVTELPSTPTFSCDNTKQFVGWTTTSINGTTDDKPAVLFTEAENAPVVTEATTYHAVFATVTGSGTAGWDQTTTVDVGDQVVIAQVDDTNGNTELTSISTTSTKYGIGTVFTGSPAGTMVFTVQSGFSEGTFAFQNGSNYLCWTSGNSLPTNMTLSANTSWQVETSNSRVLMKNSSDASRVVMWNKNDKRFACYSGKNHGDNSGQYYYHIVFYKKLGGQNISAYQTTCATLESIALSGNYKTTFTVGDDFVFAGKVTATYDNAETKDVTNDVTLSSHTLTSTGTQEVTVSYTEGGVTKTAKYTITINAAKETGTFQQYTGELVEGDYVIYYQKDSESDGYAMKAAVSSDRLVAAVEGTDFAKESDIITNPDRSLVWHIAPNGSNWTIYNDKTGKYAAGTGVKNEAQLLVRDDEGKILWTASGTYEFENVHNADKGVNKNLRNNGDYGFACYATGTGGALSLYKYTEGVVSAPVITGEADFTTSTTVTITASTGDIYYTTDGNAPTTSSTKYIDPFTIYATTTVKAIAHKDGTSSSVAEKKFTKHELLTVEQAMALDEDEEAYLNTFEVVKVIKDYGYIFIKDDTGAGLIYDKDNAKGMESLVEGASVSEFIGTKDLFYNHPQLTPNVAYSDLNVTGSDAAVATEITALAEADLNKYVVLKGVTFATATNISTHPTNNGIKYRAQFGSSYQFEVGTSYDIYGFVGKYNDDLRFWFLEAAVAGSTVERYSVTYDKGEGDVQGTLPEDNETYAAGTEVNFKDHSLTREGYNFTGWKVTNNTTGEEVSVNDNKFNMPSSNVTATAQWQESLDFNSGYWVLVETIDQLSAGNYVVIAAAEANKAMLSYESGTNCKVTAITKNGKLMTFGETAPGIFQLENGDEGTFAFRDIANTTADEYLCSTGNSNNLTSSTANKGLFNIWVSEGVATITSTSNSRSVRYNKSDNSNLLFSCYESGQSAVALYKYMTMPTPVFSLTTGNYVGAQTVTVDCAIAEATIYYTTDGTTPTTNSERVAVGGSINIPTTCTLKAIAVEGTNKSEVVSATYTLVTAGVWTLVRDVDELQEGDLVVMASNANGVVNGANAKSEYFATASVTFTSDKDKAAITEFSNEALIFTLKKATNGEWLLASGNNYVDLHGDKLNALVAEPSTTWTISVDEDFNATIANGSLMFRYNKGVTPLRFKAYLNGTGTLPQLYKLVTTYTRTVSAGDYGTICLPGEASSYTGAEFYEISWMEMDGANPKSIWLDQVNGNLVAGKPYIFKANASTLSVTYDNTTVSNVEEGEAGLVGTYAKIEDFISTNANNTLEGNYMISGNQFLLCPAGCWLNANHAYIDASIIANHTSKKAEIPGRRRVVMGAAGENAATGVDNIITTDAPVKVIENGQLIIIRNGEKYNIQGQLIK